MKRKLGPALLTLVVTLPATVFGGTWAAGQVSSMRDEYEVAQMTEKTKTICAGRFLIDLPAQAEVNILGERIAGFEIETVAEDETAFRERVAAREAEIVAIGDKNDGKGGLVEVRDLQNPGMIGRTLIFGRTRGYLMEDSRRVDLESVSVEVHAHVGDFSFTLSAEFVDEARARLAEAMLARLQLRGEDAIPSVPGFCTRHAVFAEPLPVQKAQHVSMTINLPGHPDLAIALFSAAEPAPGPGLLERIAEVDSAASRAESLRVTKLRSGRRSINGMPGEEVVERVRGSDFTTGYVCNWETKGQPENSLVPFLSLEMESGARVHPASNPVESSLHGDAVLALWDRISSTIRLRAASQLPTVGKGEQSGQRLPLQALRR